MNVKPVTLNDLSALLGGDVYGDGDTVVEGVNTIQSARPGEIAFVDNPKYHAYLKQTQASALILNPTLKSATTKPRLIVANPKLTFARVVEYFYPEPKPVVGIHPTALVGKDCKLGNHVSIGAYSVLEDRVELEDNVVIGSHCFIGQDVRVGKGTKLHPKVLLYSNVHLGQACLIHSGVVVGSDGFGFANQEGRWVKVPQVGGVRIGDCVEIGANTTIDRGSLENTVIEEGVILDNLIQIGHNVKVGKHTAIAACCGLAGSCTIGAYCMIGGASIFNGHITITDRCYFVPGSQVANSIKKPGVYSSGIPARDRSLWAKNVARFHQLDNLAQKVKTIQRQVKTLNDVVEESKE